MMHTDGEGALWRCVSQFDGFLWCREGVANAKYLRVR